MNAPHIKGLCQAALDHAQAPADRLAIMSTTPLLIPQAEQLPSDGFAATNRKQPMSADGSSPGSQSGESAAC